MTGNNPRGHTRQAGRIAGESMMRAAGGPGSADLDSSLPAVPMAFYGRTAHGTGTGDSQADRHRQLALCSAVAAAFGARVSAGFFDEDCRADDPWQDRPQGRFLLAALSGPGRPAAAVAVADPWRLLPRRPAPDSTAILARLAFLRVPLMLADSGILICTAAEYALLSRLLTSPACCGRPRLPVTRCGPRPAQRDRLPGEDRPRVRAVAARRRSGAWQGFQEPVGRLGPASQRQPRTVPLMSLTAATWRIATRWLRRETARGNAAPRRGSRRGDRWTGLSAAPMRPDARGHAAHANQLPVLRCGAGGVHRPQPDPVVIAGDVRSVDGPASYLSLVVIDGSICRSPAQHDTGRRVGEYASRRHERMSDCALRARHASLLCGT
jgi:hypothetical protein